jgi:hypothetical protein
MHVESLTRERPPDLLKVGTICLRSANHDIVIAMVVVNQTFL